MDTDERHKHNMTLGIAVVAGSLVILGTLLGELIPIMSIWYLNNAPANYVAYITLQGFTISQANLVIVDSQADLFSIVFIAGMVVGGIFIILGTVRGFHKSIFAGTMVTFVSMFVMALILPAIIDNLTNIPQGIDKLMYDATLSPSFTFSYFTPSGYVSQFLGGGYWLVGAGSVLGFLAWYRLSSNVNPEDQQVLTLEKQVEHSARHIEIKRRQEAREKEATEPADQIA